MRTSSSATSGPVYTPQENHLIGKRKKLTKQAAKLSIVTSLEDTMPIAHSVVMAILKVYPTVTPDKGEPRFYVAESEALLLFTSINKEHRKQIRKGRDVAREAIRTIYQQRSK